MISYVTLFCGIMLNMCIFIDLKLTIYNPFYVRSKRNKIYALMTFLAAMLGIFYRCLEFLTDREEFMNSQVKMSKYYILYAIPLIVTHVYTV